MEVCVADVVRSIAQVNLIRRQVASDDADLQTHIRHQSETNAVNMIVFILRWG
jgi:hypothetical protein